MGLILFAAFVAVPIIEIALLIELGGFLGTPATVLLVIATAAAGTWLLRQQGRATLLRAQTEIQQGRLPANELFDGLCLFAAGLLLLTPGLLTDGLGGALLIPLFRRWLQSRLAQRLTTMTLHMHQRGNTHTSQGDPFQSNPFQGGPFGTDHSTPKPGQTYEGDFTVVQPDSEKSEDTPPPNRTLH